MNYPRIALAAVAATVVYFVYGFLVFGLLIAHDYSPYPNVYRSADAVKSYMALGMGSFFIALLVLAVMYAKGYEGGPGVAEGARFGFLMGIFMACTHVADNYVTLNIGGTLALHMALAGLVQWTLLGMAVGLVYKPGGGRPLRS